MAKLISILFLLFTSLATAELEYHSDRIKMMDVEILQQIVSKDIQKLQDPDENTLPIIKHSLEIVLAQPDHSLASIGIVSQLKNLSGGDENFAKVLNDITDDAIASLKQDKKDQALQREQNSYLYILKHMLAEIQGSKDEEPYKKIIERIRDEDIRVSDHLTSYRLLNSMDQVENPSKYAATIIPKKDPWWKFW